MNSELARKYKIHPSEVSEAVTRFPEIFEIGHRSTGACAFLSIYIFELSLKIQHTATPEQVKKFGELQQAYVDIVNDVSHVYRLEHLIGQYQHSIETLVREKAELKAENIKLTETLNFQ